MASLPSPTQVAGDQVSQFEGWYKKVDPSGSGAIQAGPAAGFLKKSGLNDNVLSRIWDLSDPGGRGYLDKTGLYVALKMVALVQSGKEASLANVHLPTPPPNMGEAPPHPAPPHPPPPHPAPPHPPPPTKPAPPATGGPAARSVWVITPQDRARYDTIFNTLGPEANKLHGSKVSSVMLNSKLPTDTLGKIWDLADMDKDGSLDRVEFSVAMHLIYKVLENNPVPSSLPQEMVSSAQRAGVAHGPVPAPLAPPSQVPQPNTPKQQPNKDILACGVEATSGSSAEKPSGPPPAPWVISAAEKARYDVMFHNADLDKDGYVSGQEIKGVFLQSGLPQMVLAHIWNLCDIKQTGKLTSEQFALAMWLIQQKMAGKDPPPALTPEMVPPTMRPKPSAESAVVPAKPQYTNPELQLVADEIEELNADKLKLETEIHHKEAGIRVKNNEIKNLQTELDTLSSTLRQLEHQKGAAQQRLDDLGNQVAKLRSQVEEQETSLKAQEDEVLSKRQELNDLKDQENQLEESVARMKKRIDELSTIQQETQLHISQARMKIGDLQDQENHMTEVLLSYDSAISSGDASSLSEASLREVTPVFNEPSFLTIGPTPTTSPKESPKEASSPHENGLPSQESVANAKAKDTSFSGGHDPFGSAFGGGQPNHVDMFGNWDQNQGAHAPKPAPPADPFGGDAFASQNKGANDMFGSEPFSGGGGGGPPPRPESPTPALPPKKAKQPPPRPAPPKTRPVKPPPPQINSNNNPTKADSNPGTTDPFGGGWGDKSGSDSFADFANFADFDNKCSKVVSSNTPSPWGDETKFSPHPGQEEKDPFGPPFSAVKDKAARSGDSSPWPQDPFGSSGFDSGDTFGETGGFGKEDPFGSLGAGTANPFGGDYDPFKDQNFKESDKFSWEDEPDPFTGLAEDGDRKEPVELKDAFGCIINEDDDGTNALAELSGNTNNNRKFSLGAKSHSSPNQKSRSRSVIGDPFASQTRATVPTRSKTSLGEPWDPSSDFDPCSAANVTTTEKSRWRSNEDLLNENFSSWGAANNNNNNNNNNINNNNDDGINPFGDSFTSRVQSWGEPPKPPRLASEDEQLAWAAQESMRLEEVRRQQEEQERAELEMALSLSRQGPTSRSPSTGL